MPGTLSELERKARRESVAHAMAADTYGPRARFLTVSAGRRIVHDCEVVRTGSGSAGVYG